MKMAAYLDKQCTLFCAWKASEHGHLDFFSCFVLFVFVVVFVSFCFVLFCFVPRRLRFRYIVVFISLAIQKKGNYKVYRGINYN